MATFKNTEQTELNNNQLNDSHQVNHPIKFSRMITNPCDVDMYIIYNELNKVYLLFPPGYFNIKETNNGYYINYNKNGEYLSYTNSDCHFSFHNDIGLGNKIHFKVANKEIGIYFRINILEDHKYEIKFYPKEKDYGLHWREQYILTRIEEYFFRKQEVLTYAYMEMVEKEFNLFENNKKRKGSDT